MDQNAMTISLLDVDHLFFMERGQERVDDVILYQELWDYLYPHMCLSSNILLHIICEGLIILKQFLFLIKWLHFVIVVDLWKDANMRMCKYAKLRW